MVQSTVNPATSNRIEVNLQSVDEFQESMSTINDVFGKDAKIVFCEDEGKVFAKKLSWPRWPRFHYCNDRVAAKLGDLLGDEGEKLADKMNSTFLCCFRLKNSLKVSEFGNAVDNYNFRRFRGGNHDPAGTMDAGDLGETLATSSESSSFDARRRTDSSSVNGQDENQDTAKTSTVDVNENVTDESSPNHKGTLSDSLSASRTVDAKDTTVADDSDLDRPLGVYVPDETPLPKIDLLFTPDNKELSRREEYSNSVETLGKALVKWESTPQQAVKHLSDAVEKCGRMKELDSTFLDRRQSDGVYFQNLSEFGAENSKSVQKQMSDEGQKEAPLPQFIRCVEGLRAYLPAENLKLNDASEILTSVKNSSVAAAEFMCKEDLVKTIDRFKDDTMTLVDQKKDQAPAESIEELAERLQVNKNYLSAIIDEFQIDWKIGAQS